MTSLRYVVLHHTDCATPHFDFMLDVAADRPLLTWRLATWPGFTTAEAIAPHRRAFLTFEGPLTDGRGSVKRVAAGVCRVVERAEASITVEIDGRQLRCPCRGEAIL